MERLLQEITRELANWVSYIENPEYVPRPANQVSFINVEKGLALAEQVKDEAAKKELLEVETSLRQIGQGLRKVKTPNSYNNVKSRAYSQVYNPTAQRSEQALKEVAGALAKSRLPTTEPAVFDGNPLEYIGWKADVDAMFSLANLTSGEKLRLLMKYVSGEPKEAIKGLSLLSSGLAYVKAIEILESRFGDPVCIAESFRHRLQTWPRIGQNLNRELRRFSDFLTQCVYAQDEFPSLKVLDDAHVIHSLAQKLPSWMLRSWQRKAAGEKGTGQYPPLSTFEEFVKIEANILDHPVLRVFDTQPSVSSRPKRERQAFVQTTGTSEAVCLKCTGKNHPTRECPELHNLEKADIESFTRQHRLCFKCAGPDHLARDCNETVVCGKCHGKHPTVFHSRYNDSTAVMSRKTRADVMVGGAMTTVVPVYVIRGSTKILTYALLDTQSDATFVAESLAQKLKLKGEEISLLMSTMTSAKQRCISMKYKDLQVRGLNEQEILTISNAYSRRFIPARADHIPTTEKIEEWSSTKDLSHHFSPYQNVPVELLIGYDCPEALAPTQLVPHMKGEPHVFRTRLGWTAIAHLEKKNPIPTFTTHRVAVIEDLEPGEVGFAYRTSFRERPVLPHKEAILSALEPKVQEKHEDRKRSVDDNRFFQKISTSILINESGKVSMDLPFRDKPPSPSNFSKETALSRWKNLERKLSQDKEYESEYTDFMEGILERGEAEIVAKETENGGWYIPHFGVRHPTSGKLRVVFDCSACTRGQCLNDFLLQGPDEINSLSGILLRFRQGSVGIACDVKKMFHQFHVSPKHRDYLRFLWRGRDGEPTTYRMTVHLFGATSSPACATYGLRYLINRQTSDKNIRDFIRRDFYVDDGITSTDNVTAAQLLFVGTRKALASGGLTLHKVVSNHEEVVNQTSADGATVSLTMGSDKLKPHKTLGIKWNLSDDVLSFEQPCEEKPNSRRGLLSAVMSMFDPLGLIAPVTLKGKLLLQDACARNLSWDEALPKDLQEKWEQWSTDLTELQELKVPRHYKEVTKESTIELHTFADASEVGYGACSYIRVINEGGNFSISLVFAKSKVTPLKRQTIPRLELQAALLAAQMANEVTQELTMKPVRQYFWSDSKIVLGYLGNTTKKFHLYVTNRIEKIRSLTNTCDWRHAMSSDNPADIASRGATPSVLRKGAWFTGPAFLMESLKEGTGTEDIVNVDLPETRSVLDTITDLKTPPNFLKNLSQWSSMVKAMKCFIRAQLKFRRQDRTEEYICRQAITGVFKTVQQEAYQEELEVMSKGGNIVGSCKLIALNPRIDHEGLMRAEGRCQNSDEDSDLKHPLILHPSHHAVIAFIRHAHESIGHGGRSATLQRLRMLGVWIPSARRQVDKIIRACVTCRKISGKFEEQIMGNLPKERTEPAAPFSYTGCDVFGPIYVKEYRRERKRYALMCTCMASRAVHIEVLEDLSTESFMLALRRLEAIRGPVKKIFCDRGTNFLGAEKELNNTGRVEPISISFNVARASHRGGVWERQIRTARRVLAGLLVKHPYVLCTDSLRTLLLEVSYIINSRPLTPVGSCDHDSAAISPNMLLTGKSEVLLKRPSECDASTYGARRWLRIEQLANTFWNKWKTEYLNELNSRQKWQKPKRNIKVGDLVMVRDNDSPRCHWELGRVEKTMTSQDEHTRTVRIRMATRKLDAQGRNRNPERNLVRPIQQLIIILEA